jgi:hypothetical protein
MLRPEFRVVQLTHNRVVTLFRLRLKLCLFRLNHVVEVDVVADVVVNMVVNMVVNIVAPIKHHIRLHLHNCTNFFTHNWVKLSDKDRSLVSHHMVLFKCIVVSHHMVLFKCNLVYNFAVFLLDVMSHFRGF